MGDQCWTNFIAVTNWSNFPDWAPRWAQYKRSPSAAKGEMFRQLMGGGSWVSHNTPAATVTPRTERMLSHSSDHRQTRTRRRRFRVGMMEEGAGRPNSSLLLTPMSPVFFKGESLVPFTSPMSSWRPRCLGELGGAWTWNRCDSLFGTDTQLVLGGRY